MKILLIDPPFYCFMGVQNRYFPIGLAYIAATLRNNGHEVNIYSPDTSKAIGSMNLSNMVDYYKILASRISEDNNPVWLDVINLLRKFEPDIVGITAMTPKMATVLKTASVCKSCNKKIKIIVGGPHATIKPDELLQHDDVDFVIRGEGENSIIDLLNVIRDDRRDRLREIDGVSFKENGNIINNKPQELIKELDQVPFPARDLLLNPDNFSSDDLAIIMTSRGCPFGCTFCFKELWGKRVRFRSIENVIEEIKQVKKVYGAKQFAFKDDSFTVNRKRVDEFCDRLLSEKININWECTTRVDLIDEDLLKKMISAGCNTIKVGIESGSKRVLQQINKGITHEKVVNAANLFNKYGIFWSAYFIMGLPDETEEEIYKTLEFMKKIRPDYTSIGVYEPYPGTELFNLGLRLGLLKESMTLEEFFTRPSHEYYLKDVNRRLVTINKDKFDEICDNVLREFDQYNKSMNRLLKRAFARRKMYIESPTLFIRDVKRAIKWVTKS